MLPHSYWLHLGAAADRRIPECAGSATLTRGLNITKQFIFFVFGFVSGLYIIAHSEIIALCFAGRVYSQAHVQQMYYIYRYLLSFGTARGPRVQSWWNDKADISWSHVPRFRISVHIIIIKLFFFVSFFSPFLSARVLEIMGTKKEEENRWQTKEKSSNNNKQGWQFRGIAK